MEIVIRRATSDDIELLTTLRLDMRRERETVPLTIPPDEFEMATREFFQWAIADGSFISFLAFCDGEPAACSGVSIQRLPPSYSAPSGLRGYITNMYTVPKWRGHGLATMLLKEIQKSCTELGCNYIDLNASDAGKPVYIKYGFTDLPGEMKLKL